MKGVFLLAALSAFLGAGCVTESSGTGVPQRLTFAGASDEHIADTEVDAARKLMNAGRHSAAIPQLVHALAQYPKTPGAIDARYLLGLSYYEIGGYQDSSAMFLDYLRLAPEGAYAKDSKRYLGKLRAASRDQYPKPEVTDARIQELTRDLATTPGNADYRSELADLLWRRGSYDEAGKQYTRILEIAPDFATDERFTSRAELLPNGAFILLTPTEIQRRQAEEQPLVIVNQNAYRSGRDEWTGKARYYVVTGQVLNRRDSVLYGVQVFVTIYGFGNLVYDTRTVNISQLRPGEKRAFSVSFSNFEYIENVDRHECIGTFVR